MFVIEVNGSSVVFLVSKILNLIFGSVKYDSYNCSVCTRSSKLRDTVHTEDPSAYPEL